jgi:hypothetical protein
MFSPPLSPPRPSMLSYGPAIHPDPLRKLRFSLFSSFGIPRSHPLHCPGRSVAFPLFFATFFSHLFSVVRVKLDEDTKPLAAKLLTVAVRCYESRLGKLNALHTNMVVEYPLTLWSKPDHLPSVDISRVEYPFKITVPVDSPGFSTANFQEYKVSWRVEAGKSEPLPLECSLSHFHSIGAYTSSRGR